MIPPRKFRVLIQAPVFSRSGYGVWADSLVPALLRYPHFEAEIEPLNFGGNVPRQSKGPDDEFMAAHFAKPGTKSFDGCICIDIPGKTIPCGNIFNWIFWAGIEADKVPDHLMQGGVVNGRKFPGMNHWSMAVMMSKFARDVCFNSNVKPKNPVEVLNACADTKIFHVWANSSTGVDRALAEIQEEEAFLFVGQRTHPHYGLDRKNQDLLVEVFCEAFKHSAKKPALIMKTNGVNFSCYDRDASIMNIQVCKAKAGVKDAPVYLLHGELTDQEMAALFCHPKIIASVTATRGEGYSLSHLQASLCGMPIIAPRYSGYLDFLDEHSTLLGGELKEIPEAAVSEFFVKGSKWFEVDREELQKSLRHFAIDGTSILKDRATGLADWNAGRFSLEAQERRLHAMLDKYLLGYTLPQ
jgi:glycosyltransferase involved in cell wall biosynthesis